ncbi:SCO family protein [Nocardiopsis mangrovi]|uniref:SCO family protein n=1 Tax=Nocardiopsis mangrovi TaxID=1179818 RepID=A0ABV9DVM0_9ACTN
MHHPTAGLRWTALGAALVCALALTACAAPHEEADYYLDLADDPMDASAITLTTVDGGEWTFADAAPDRLTLLFFGYTSCPDVCPMTMAEIHLALADIGDDAERFDVVMVTTDPARDTGDQLKSWLARFDPSFQGVRGDIDDTVQAALDYGIPIEPPEEVEGDYLVSHGGRIIVLGDGGEALGMFDEGTEADRIAALLPGLADTLL